MTMTDEEKQYVDRVAVRAMVQLMNDVSSNDAVMKHVAKVAKENSLTIKTVVADMAYQYAMEMLRAKRKVHDHEAV